jgi:hypothetical protein
MRDQTTTPPAEPERTEDLLYGDPDVIAQTYRPTLLDAAERLADHTGWSQAELDTHLREMAGFFNDAGIHSTDAARVHTLIARHLREPADEATVRQWETQARERLRTTYGISEGQRRLEAAKQFVKARPALAKSLVESGAGSHPDVIAAIAENLTPGTTRVRMTPRGSGPDRSAS